MEKKRNKIKNEVKKQTFGYLLAAFGLVAGLAWNEAIKALIESVFPKGQEGLLAKFGYAVLITLVLVILSIYLKNIFEDKEETAQ